MLALFFAVKTESSLFSTVGSANDPLRQAYEGVARMSASGESEELCLGTKDFIVEGKSSRTSLAPTLIERLQLHRVL